MTNNNNKPSLDTRLKTKTEKFKQKVFFLCASLFLSSLFFVLGRSLRAVPFLMAWAIVFFLLMLLISSIINYHDTMVIVCARDQNNEITIARHSLD